MAMTKKRFRTVAPVSLAVLSALVVLAMLPAVAAPSPELITGDPTCATVSSPVTGAFRVDEPQATNASNPSRTYTNSADGFSVTLGPITRTAFNLISANRLIRDIVVKGSASNLYRYSAPGITSDTGFVIPNGNKINRVWFCYDPTVPTFSISGNKFEDANADGIHQVTEPGLQGWTIQLKQGTTVLQSTTTDANGAYSFNAEAGSYQVCEVLEDGFVPTSPDGCHSVSVGPSATGLNFLNAEGIDICEEDASVIDEGQGISATFTVIGDCDLKVVEVDVDGNEVVFIPKGTVAASFDGILTFTKANDDPSALVLKYDPNDDDAPDEADFRAVPDCGGTPTAPVLTDPEVDSWCVVAASADYQLDSMWTIEWQIYGEADPRFK